MLAIHQQKQRLDQLFKAARDLPDPEVQSHWSRYLCVLVSGFIENSVELCLYEYSKKSSSIHVSNFVSARLRKFQNPKMGPILELFGTFNPEWRSRIEAATRGRLADSINSIVTNRNKIAHGDSVSLSMSSLTAYYQDAASVIEILQQTCGL
jgi:nitrate/nitrite-specific signal transduction histidine kinase